MKSALIVHITIGALVLGCGLITREGHGQSLDVQFEFVETSFIVNPTDVIRVQVTITNLLSSSAVLSGQDLDSLQIIGGTLCGIDDPYNIDFGPPGDDSGFFFLKDNLNLAPGESMTFDFGHLTPWPKRPPVSSGVYSSGLANIKFSGMQYYTSSNLVVTVVPEPTTVALAVFGLTVYCAMGRGRRRDSK